MRVPSVSQRIEHVATVHRRGRHAMAALLAGAVLAIAVRAAAPWISLGLVAGVLVFGCLAVCVLTAWLDERAWRGVQHDLEELRRGRGHCA